MNTVEVWLVRHSETIMNAQGRLSGWVDVTLTDCGRRQARWLQPWLKAQRFDGVWSSDLSRARETARLAWGEAWVDVRLREIDFGLLEGCEYEILSDECKDGLNKFDGFRAPGGETTEQLRDRVHEFLDGLEPGRHLIFTHGGVIRVVMRQVGLERFLSNGSVLAVDWTGGNLLFVQENELGTSSAMVRDTECLTGCVD